MDTFSKSAGAALRGARVTRGWTLRDVARQSGGRFKPSVVGGYERGERAISVERFCDLASFYGVPPDRLLAEAMAALDPSGRTEIVIDLNRLALVDEAERSVLAEFIHQLKSRRRDYLSDIVTLRAGDVEALALQRRIRPDRLLSQLQPAIVGPASQPS